MSDPCFGDYCVHSMDIATPTEIDVAKAGGSIDTPPHSEY